MTSPDASAAVNISAELLSEMFTAVSELLNIDGTVNKTVEERAVELDGQEWPEPVDPRALANLLRVGARAGLVRWS